MSPQFYGANPCNNMNHRRSDAPVGHCPDCGAVVNSQLRTANCGESAHAEARRQRWVFCSRCGLRLIPSP